MKLFISFGLLLSNLAPAADLYFPPPGQQWQTISPAEAGWDTAKLDAALTFAGQRKSSGVVILLDGKILAERHWNLKSPRQLGADAQGHAIEDVASVQKSVVSILAGIAQERGLIDIDDPVEKHLGQGWSKAPRADEARITLRHLLTMTSGLTARLTLEAPAGEKWRYNTTAYSRSRQAIATAAGKTPNALTREWLTGPIGMADSKWEPRRGPANQLAANPLGFASTARDLARLGLLVLARGEWNGTVILGDREYLRQAISPSQRLNPSYGYLWWLNGQEFAVRGTRKVPGWLISAAPKDLVAALGALGRKVYVVPSLGLVVTRLGAAPEVHGAERFDNGFWKLLMAAAPAGVRTE